MSRYSNNRRGARSRLLTFARDHNDGTYTNDFDHFDAEILERLNCNPWENEDISEDEESDDGNSEKGKGKSSNQKAKETTEATGVRATDFAVRPVRPLPGASNSQAFSSARILADYPVPTVFPVHKKHLQFEYMRFLYRQGVFDLPRVDFTPQDADRLYTLRIMTLRRATDTPLLAAMLAAGAHQRYQRHLADASESLPCWTVPIGIGPATPEEIRNYIIKEEKRRYRIPDPRQGYPYIASQRPELTSDYVQHRIQEHGTFGLEITHNIRDEQAFDMIKSRDKTWIDPGRFVKGRWMYHTGDSRPVMPEGKRFYAYRHNVLAPERVPSSSGQTGPSGSSSKAQRPRKGKKRAHEADPEEENDGSTRRLRARHSETISTTTSTTAASSSSALALRPLTASASAPAAPNTRARHSSSPPTFASGPGASSSSTPAPHIPSSNASASSSRGKKRAHDDEGQDENSTPAKKAKATYVEEDNDSDIEEITDPCVLEIITSSSTCRNRRSTRYSRARHSTTSSITTSTPGASSSSAHATAVEEIADPEVEEIADPRTLTTNASAREHHSTTSTTAIPIPEASSSSAPAPRTPTTDASSSASFARGQKRARDDEEDENSTSAKKVKTTDAEGATIPEAGLSGTTHVDTEAPTTPELVSDMETEINTGSDSDTDSISSLTVEVGDEDEDDVPHHGTHRPLERTDAFVLWGHEVHPKSANFTFSRSVQAMCYRDGNK